MSTAFLSRLQFAITVSFHFVFPPMTIGLGLALVVMQALRVWTGKRLYLEMARYWTKIFGLIFAIGVATGIPMEFQFGMNWAHYARFVGDIFGSPLAIEGIYAFFMESGFLALLLFGWHKIGPKMHLFSTCMVALGAHFSAIWILVANSWMQTPAGFHLAHEVKVTAGGQQFPITADLGPTVYTVQEVPLPPGYVVRPEDLGHVRAVVDNIGAAILNPSVIERLCHTILACWITGAFVVVGISAWWLLRGRYVESARASLKIGLVIAAGSCVLQMVAGDATARGVALRQPTKLAAMEGLEQTQRAAPLGLVGWVRWKRNDAGQISGVTPNTLHVPGLLSILVSGDFLHPARALDTQVEGLTQLPAESLLRARHPGVTEAELPQVRTRYWPNAPLLFQTFHLMVLLGGIMLLASLLACWWWKTGRLWKTELRSVRTLLSCLVVCPFLAQVATQAGWLTTEIGRQPWIVYQVLKTGDSVSPTIRASQVFFSMSLFFIIYLFLTYLFVTLLRQKMRHGPTYHGDQEELSEKWRPLSMRSGRQIDK